MWRRRTGVFRTRRERSLSEFGGVPDIFQGPEGILTACNGVVEVSEWVCKACWWFQAEDCEVYTTRPRCICNLTSNFYTLNLSQPRTHAHHRITICLTNALICVFYPYWHHACDASHKIQRSRTPYASSTLAAVFFALYKQERL